MLDQRGFQTVASGLKYHEGTQGHIKQKESQNSDAKLKYISL